MSEHHLDPDIAKEYGVHCALLIYNIDFWIHGNAVRKKQYYFHRRKYWTTFSITTLQKTFYYLTPRQIHYACEKLKTTNVVETDKFNERKGDQTLWYTFTEDFLKQHKKNLRCCRIPDDNNIPSDDDDQALTDAVLSTLQNCKVLTAQQLETFLQICKMQFTNLSVPFHKIVKPLIDKNKDNIIDNTHTQEDTARVCVSSATQKEKEQTPDTLYTEQHLHVAAGLKLSPEQLNLLLTNEHLSLSEAAKAIPLAQIKQDIRGIGFWLNNKYLWQDGTFIGTLPATNAGSSNNGNPSVALTWYQGLSSGEQQQVDADIVQQLGDKTAFLDAWNDPAKRWKSWRVQQVLGECYQEVLKR